MSTGRRQRKTHNRDLLAQALARLMATPQGAIPTLPQISQRHGAAYAASLLEVGEQRADNLIARLAGDVRDPEQAAANLLERLQGYIPQLF